MLNKYKNKAYLACDWILSLWPPQYCGWRRRLLWLQVLFVSYFNHQAAEKMAVGWHEDFREWLLKIHKFGVLHHVGQEPRDSITYKLALIRGEKQDCKYDLFMLRYIAKCHIKSKDKGISWRKEWI